MNAHSICVEVFDSEIASIEERKNIQCVSMKKRRWKKNVSVAPNFQYRKCIWRCPSFFFSILANGFYKAEKKWAIEEKIRVHINVTLVESLMKINGRAQHRTCTHTHTDTLSLFTAEYRTTRRVARILESNRKSILHDNVLTRQKSFETKLNTWNGGGTTNEEWNQHFWCHFFLLLPFMSMNCWCSNSHVFGSPFDLCVPVILILVEKDIEVSSRKGPSSWHR